MTTSDITQFITTTRRAAVTGLAATVLGGALSIYGHNQGMEAHQPRARNRPAISAYAPAIAPATLYGTGLALTTVGIPVLMLAGVGYSLTSLDTKTRRE